MGWSAGHPVGLPIRRDGNGVESIRTQDPDPNGRMPFDRGLQ